MSGLVKFENIKNLIIEIRAQSVLLDSDVAQIYGVETRDINKAVANNPDKFPGGYIVELTKPEKNELVENFHRLDKLKRAEYGLLYWLMKDIQRGQSRIFLRCKMMETLPLAPFNLNLPL